MSNEQRNFKPSRVDVDADRMFALQAEGRAELEARKKVATKKQPKPKKRRIVRGTPKKVDYNLMQHGIKDSLKRVHAEHSAGIIPYSSPKQPNPNSAIVQRLQAAQPKTKLRVRS